MDALTASALSDDDFIAAFEQRRLDEFPHRFHLRMAWIYIARLGLDGAIDRVREEIKGFAEQKGQAGLYHETITRAWLYLVAHTAHDAGAQAGFDDLLVAHAELLDKGTLLRHYTRETLTSADARARWIEPDLRPLPGAPPSDPGAPVVGSGDRLTP